MDSNEKPDGQEESSNAPLDPELVRRSKISPHLRAIVHDWERRRREERQSSAVPSIQVLIELKTADPSELEKAGIEFTLLFERMYSARLPLDKLDDLADLETILRVHHEPKTQPDLDDSIPDVRASTVRNSGYPFAGTDKFTGAGILVGIIDNGINSLHPVFRLPNDQTKSRIRAIHDQSVTPAVTYTKAQIEAAIATNTQLIQPGTTRSDDHKHGTHVAGIAAGNGKIASDCSGEYTYVGVAPEAELVIVKYNFGGTTSLLNAIQFIAGIADTDGKPVVINMSLGHAIGPHDGTDPMDRMIDNYLLVRSILGAQPVVLVASAGNKGRLGQHATGLVNPASAVKRLRFEMNPQKSVTGQATTTVDIRFTATNGMGCRLIPPGNTITGGNLAAPDAAASFTENGKNSSCTISGTVIPGAPAGSRRITITVTSTAAGTNQPGEWVIELTNAHPTTAITYHAWIDGDQYDKLKTDQSRANTVGSPGSATDIITVGNHCSSGKDKGKIYESSSRGPRLDNLQKPDLSAPGHNINSAKRDFHTGCCCDCCCESYIDMTGTSMAAPHVSGAVALILQRNPALTHQDVKTVLLRTARLDSFTGMGPNNDFGNGKLTVLSALNDALVRGAGNVIMSEGAPARAHAVVKSVPTTTAPEMPKLPQLQEGTPLWRLLHTAEGHKLYLRGRTHWEEVRALVNSNKRIATVWHRNHGPLLMHHVTRTAMLPHVPLPREWDGEELSIRAARLVSALEPHASKELIRALHETLPLIAQLQGKTLLELVEMFEANEVVEHA